jgi:hypothetical protein
MPPSAEGLTKPPAPDGAERRAAGRHPGKQRGAESSYLAQVDDRHDVVIHSPGGVRRLWQEP